MWDNFIKCIALDITTNTNWNTISLKELTCECACGGGRGWRDGEAHGCGEAGMRVLSA